MKTEPIKYLVARIRQALAEDERTNILDLQVNVTAGRLYLIGPVDSPERRAAAEDVAREFLPPGMTIINQLWLPNYSLPPESETVP